MRVESLESWDSRSGRYTPSMAIPRRDLNGHQRSRPTVVDLFAGAGGMSLGFEQAGFDVVAAVEYDPVHAAVHKYNFPECAIVTRPIELVTGSEIRQAAQLGESTVDCVIGGAPCQGFSLIGQRALDDPRNALVRDFVRVVVELRARSFVFENVKGLTLGPHRAFLEELIREFQIAGYEVQLPYQVLNAASYATPQSRERLFLLGVRKGLKLPWYPEPRTSIVGRNGKERTLAEAVTVSDALADLPDVDSLPSLLDSDEIVIDLPAPLSSYASEMRGITRASDDMSYKRAWDTSRLTNSRATRHTPISRRRFAATSPGHVEPISRFLKLDPSGICNTLRAGSDGARGAFTSPRPIHPLHSRCVSVREMARLHGFPDWFRFNTTKWHGARQIGNAVPPPLARAVGHEVRKVLCASPPSPPKRVVQLGDPTWLTFDMSAASSHFGIDPLPNRRDRKSGSRKRSQEQVELDLKRVGDGSSSGSNSWR